MNDVLDPPAERDMPPGRSNRMQADLMAAIHRPEPGRHVRRRLVVLAAAVAAAVTGVTASVVTRPDGPPVEVVAMGVSELSPILRGTAEQCLEWNTRQRADSETEPRTVAVTMADLAVTTQRQDHAVALFLTSTGYFACEVATVPGHEVSGGNTSGTWQSRNWLPGPVQRLGMASTELDGGTVMVTGRVGDRVHRLVLDHGDRKGDGDGHTTTARIQRGVFGVISDGAVMKNAELVSYDRDGNEIGRSPLYRPYDPSVPKSERKDQYDRCYVDSSGKVVYGNAGTDCLPAEPWSH